MLKIIFFTANLYFYIYYKTKNKMHCLSSDSELISSIDYNHASYSNQKKKT